MVEVVVDGIPNEELVATGLHDPSIVINRDFHVECMAYDSQRV